LEEIERFERHPEITPIPGDGIGNGVTMDTNGRDGNKNSGSGGSGGGDGQEGGSSPAPEPQAPVEQPKNPGKGPKPQGKKKGFTQGQDNTKSESQKINPGQGH
jgi:hypothetical protein